MKFPWYKYDELPVERINTLQIFITNDCNLKCRGCLARNIMGDDKANISIEEYKNVITKAVAKGCQRITLIGGEPLLHPNLRELIQENKKLGIKTTIYTNGYHLNNYIEEDFKDVTIRVSLYCKTGKLKSITDIPPTKIPFEVCFMVSRKTTVQELVETANFLEQYRNCKLFFISSLRELDNPNKEFFEDTELTMPILEYKKLVHEFLYRYDGDMEIHISKRGVFESTINMNGNKCKFANYFIGGKIIQCPYDIVNSKFISDYKYDERFCQHNSTCMMTKIKLKRKMKEITKEKKMKMYILIRENIPVELAPVVSAHASLACYLTFKDNTYVAEDMKKWLDTSFVKVLCSVNETEWKKAQEFCEGEFIAITESTLKNKEVALVYAPKADYPEFFSHLKLWKPELHTQHKEKVVKVTKVETPKSE